MSTLIDLSSLPAPKVIEELDYDTILNNMLTTLRARDETYTALVASDPLYKFAEDVAYRILYERQRKNDAASAVLLAKSTGTDLDGLAAYYNLLRLVVDPGDATAIPPIAATYESDADFRNRILLVFDGNNTAGSVNGYIFHAKSASGSVRDVAVKSPSDGAVEINILSTAGNGSADAALISLVEAVVKSDSIKPLTDFVTVKAATIVSYTIVADLYVYNGPDQSEVLLAVQNSLAAHVNDMHKIGRDITQSGLFAALHIAGVQRVVINNPIADIVIDDDEAGYNISSNVSIVGIVE